MKDFTTIRVNEFLDQVAERTPTPGGGGVAAAAGAMACAMARMVAAYSVQKKTDPKVRAEVEAAGKRLEHTDKLLRALITQDAAAYAGLTEAAKAARDDPSAKSAHAEALMVAISVPMEMAALVSNALFAMDEFKTKANRYLLSDLGVAAVLADAAGQAAAYSVRVNARELADEVARAKVSADVEETLAHCARLRESVESFVRDQLENAPPADR